MGFLWRDVSQGLSVAITSATLLDVVPVELLEIAEKHEVFQVLGC